jgi:RimJ/RimL family protein N-acetyltransferase
MIKIGPLLATDYGQACYLLKLQEESNINVTPLSEYSLIIRSLAFWQHWLPMPWHVSSSVYVAREGEEVLGLICLHSTGKSKQCWQIDNLIVHPEHRGRGIAQELLRYVFAQFGSQGASHFVAEISQLNEAALALFASCGFCRTAKISYSVFDPKENKNNLDLDNCKSLENQFMYASPRFKHMLYQLQQDVLPPELRLIYSYIVDDFMTREPLPFTSTEKTLNKFLRKRLWYWVRLQAERKTLTQAAKIIAQPNLGYQLEFAIHPGFKHLAKDILDYSLYQLLSCDMPSMPIRAKVYDFQDDLQQALIKNNFVLNDEYCLLTKEHWLRAKKTKEAKLNKVAIPPMSQTSINPLPSEMSIVARD